MLNGEIKEAAERTYPETGAKQRRFADITYGADTWDRARRVIVKAEHSAKATNPRYVVTHLKGDAQAPGASAYLLGLNIPPYTVT